MINFTSKPRYMLDDLIRLVHALRAPGGCPWDAAQTHLSIRRNFLEEAYEACEALDCDDEAMLREELGDAQVYAYLAANLPRRETARLFRALSEEEKRHARDLAAAIYLITGKPYCPRVCVERPDMGDLCALLRALYHGEACAGYNYARAGEETLDLCLSKLFAAMSADEYRHAELLMKLLGRKMNV